MPVALQALHIGQFCRLQTAGWRLDSAPLPSLHVLFVFYEAHRNGDINQTEEFELGKAELLKFSVDTVDITRGISLRDVML